MISPATTKKAAELGSPGISIFCGDNFTRPFIFITSCPSEFLFIIMSASNNLRRFSVWSRVLIGSIIVYVPDIFSADKIKAVLTCADGIVKWW